MGIEMEQEEHNIDWEALKDHAGEQHMDVQRLFVAALQEQTDRDPKFCILCAMTGVSIIKVTELQYLMSIGSDHERTELQPDLDAALRERMAVPLHGAPPSEVS